MEIIIHSDKDIPLRITGQTFEFTLWNSNLTTSNDFKEDKSL
jgi:hypothetical protein